MQLVDMQPTTLESYQLLVLRGLLLPASNPLYHCPLPGAKATEDESVNGDRVAGGAIGLSLA